MMMISAISFDDLDNNDIPNTQDVLNESFQTGSFFSNSRIKGPGLGHAKLNSINFRGNYVK